VITDRPTHEVLDLREEGSMFRPELSPTPKTRYSRRTILRWGGAAVAAASGPFVWTPARAQGFNWKRFQGKELFVILIKWPWTDVIEKNLPEFETLTGMKVRVETLPQLQARQKVLIEMTGGSGGLDAFFTTVNVDKKRYTKAGWFEPLNRYLQDRTLTPPDWDWEDISAGSKAMVTQKDGTVSALPISVEAWGFFYRTDLFAARGLEPAKTYDELAAQARQLHNPPAVYGIVYRGLKNSNAATFSNAQFAFGADFLTRDGKAALDTSENIAALDWYAGTLRKYGPPGAINYDFYECSTAFMQGQAAIYTDGMTIASQFEDPSKSKVVGRVGYTLMPAGPKGQFSSLLGSALAVSSQSRNKEAAYLFCQWATSKQNAVRGLLAGSSAARTSAWSHPEVKAKARMPASWSQTYVDSMKIGRPALPEIVGVTEYRDIIGVAIQKAIEGAPSAQVLAQANREFQEMLDKTEG
jgi:multiple sugar transport system substrate-binding protein